MLHIVHYVHDFHTSCKVDLFHVSYFPTLFQNSNVNTMKMIRFNAFYFLLFLSPHYTHII